MRGSGYRSLLVDSSFGETFRLFPVLIYLYSQVTMSVTRSTESYVVRGKCLFFCLSLSWSSNGLESLDLNLGLNEDSKDMCTGPTGTSSRRNLCNYDDTLTLVTGRGLESVEGCDLEVGGM